MGGVDVTNKPRIRDWRQVFPDGPPPAGSPASQIELYLSLRFYELVRWCDRAIDYALRGVPEKDKKGVKHRRPATDEDLARVKPHLTSIDRTFRELEHWRTVHGYTPDEATIEDIDLDALATEVCRRIQVEWPGAEAKTPLGKERMRVGVEGPTSKHPLAQKRAWFLNLHSTAMKQSDSLSQKSGEFEKQLRDGKTSPDWTKKEVSENAASVKVQRQMVTVAFKALKHKSTIVAAWGRLLGAVFDQKDVKQQRAIDLLANVVAHRQRTWMKLKDWRRPRLGTLKWLIATMKAAREGDYYAYRDCNGFTESSKGSRWVPLFMGDAHRTMIQTLLSDMICKGCHKFHLQDQTPIWNEGTGMEYVPPVTCPYCGLEDCAGPRCHRLAACRGLGKSTEGRMTFAFRKGIHLRRDYVPDSIILSGTIDEAIKRKRIIVEIMRRAAHRLIFPQAVAHAAPSAKVLTVVGIDRPIVNCYGIKSLPAGSHVDDILADDVVNEDNVFRVPADMIVVGRKLSNVLRYSDKPWTVIDWLTTVWKVDDPDHELEKVAERQPDRWVNTIIAAGGPDPVYDESGEVLKKPPWWSPWLERWDEDALKALHDEDEFAYQRAMQMIRVSDKDCIFHGFHFYITDADPLLKEVPEEYLKECNLVKRTDLASWNHVAGFDLAFTAAEKANSQTSRTATTVLAVDPYSKNQYVRWSNAQYLEPSEHEGYVVQTWTQYHRAEIVIETDHAVSELVDRLRDQGCSVDTYTPGKYGAKAYRKYPLAVNVNSGRILFPGRLARNTVQGGWTVEPMPWLQSDKRGLLDDLKIFPAKLGDNLDSLEVASRMAEEYYGGPAEERPDTKTETRNEMQEWRDSFYKDAKEDEDELAEAMAMLGDGSDDMERFDLGVDLEGIF